MRIGGRRCAQASGRAARRARGLGYDLFDQSVVHPVGDQSFPASGSPTRSPNTRFSPGTHFASRARPTASRPSRPSPAAGPDTGPGLVPRAQRQGVPVAARDLRVQAQQHLSSPAAHPRSNLTIANGALTAVSGLSSSSPKISDHVVYVMIGRRRVNKHVCWLACSLGLGGSDRPP